MDIKAIQTRYDGYLFRSRLEARWAVYFDAVGLKWEYEKEGFNFDGTLYLPDFWFPQVEMWAEIKPCEFNQDELRKAALLAWQNSHDVVLIDGQPEVRTFKFIRCEDSNSWGEIGLEIGIDVGEDERLLVKHDCALTPCWITKKAVSEKEAEKEIAKMIRGVNAARSARFEHGQYGPQ